MLEKQEILNKLTGIHSSRKSYYKELNYVVDEMKKKNKQLEVINQLTKIPINATWNEVSSSIAKGLSQLIPFSSFALVLVEGSTLSTYLAERDDQQWRSRVFTKSMKRKPPYAVTDVNRVLEEEFPYCHITSVSLRSHLNQVFGFLTLINEGTYGDNGESLSLFSQIAEHVGVTFENVLLFKDVSQKVHLEAQLVQSAKLAAIGEMAAGVAHELNSPLTAILGNIQLLMRTIDEEPFQRMMQDIYKCGVRCKKIIQNLLTFSRQEEYSFEILPLNDLVEDVLGLIGYQLSAAGVCIHKKLADDCLSIRASRHQIEQIFINLLLNARDALQGRNSPEIAIETSFVQREDRSYAALSVWDNGEGIKPEQQQQIFLPFFTTKEKTKGTGLGLSVSLGIAQSHDGELLVESEPGEYSKFTLLLPIYSAEECSDGEETSAHH